MPPDSAEADAIAFVLHLGKALHRYGTPAHRLEEALLACCTRLDLAHAEVLTTPNAIIMSFGEPHQLRTRMMRVEGSVLDMDKLSQVDAIVDAVATRSLSANQGLARLREIGNAKPRYNRVLSTLVNALTASTVAVFLGGSLADVAAAGVVGVLIGVLAQVATRSVDRARLYELVGALVAALVAGLISSVWPAVSPPLVTVASLIVLLPGMLMTVAMTELTTRHIISGTARSMFALIVLLELVVGVALGERIASSLVNVNQVTAIPLPTWTQWIALGGSAIGFAIVVQAAPRAFGWILAASFVAYMGSRLGNSWLGGDMGVLVGAFALGVTSNAYARLLKRPAQVVMVPAVFVLVPGGLGFRGMSSLVGHEILSGIETVFAMFLVAVGIAVGLLVANAAVSPRRSL